MKVEITSVDEDGVNFELDDEAEEALTALAIMNLGENAPQDEINEFIITKLEDAVRAAVQDMKVNEDNGDEN